MRGLYAILDHDASSERGVDLAEAALAIARARPVAIQLRAKSAHSRATLGMLRRLQSLLQPRGLPLFANDRPDLALLAGAAGVHLGQDDVPLSSVRALDSDLRVGVSTHDWRQLEAALAERPDYVAFGPVWNTRSKRAADPALGPELTRRAARFAKQAGVPLVAIGGISAENLAELRPEVECVAVIADLLPPPGELDPVRVLESIQVRAERLVRAFC